MIVVRGGEHVEQTAPRIALLSMKRRRSAWLALSLTAAVAGLLCYSWSVHSAKSRRAIVERDVIDVATSKAVMASYSYDPYFNRVNHSANLMVSSTNAVTRSQ